jgi:hypothetical protein
VGPKRREILGCGDFLPTAQTSSVCVHLGTPRDAR